MGYRIFPLSEFIRTYPEEDIQKRLSLFRCSRDRDLEDFLHRLAIPYEKRELARVYQALDTESGSILGYFSLSMRCGIVLKDSRISRSMYKHLNVQSETDVAQMYLIGQLGRADGSEKGFGKQLMADAVSDLMEIPGVNALQSFARDRIIMTSVTCKEGGKLLGQSIMELEQYEPKCKVVAVYRHGTALTKLDHFKLLAGDEVILCVERARALNLVGALMPLRPSGMDVVIQGGTHIADSIALRLAERYHVKLIEPDTNRAKRLADRLRGSKVEIYCADASDANFVQEEKLYETDTFIAASAYDETNIMAALMLQRSNKVRTIAVIRQLSTQDLASTGSPIDTIISPRDAIISALLSLILQEGLVKMRIFRHGQAEALELLVQGDPRASFVVGRKLEDLTLPPGVHFGLALREKVVLKIDQDYVFSPGDHVVAFLSDRIHMRALVKMFKPRPFWLPHWR